MKLFMRLLCVCTLLLCLTLTQAQASGEDSGSGSITLLFEAGGADTRAWFERALSEDPPKMLIVWADEETHLWDAEIYDKDRIRSYLHALEAVEVDVSRQVGMWDDALTMTYTFHMRDGGSKTFLLQEGRVCVDPRQVPGDVVYPVVGAGGMESFQADLASLDKATLAQLRAVEQSNKAEQARQIVIFEGDTLSLILEENSTTGYLWSYSIEPEGALLCVKDEYKPDKNSRNTSGGGGHRLYSFQSTGTGDALLQLVRRGPDGSPDHKTAFQVYVDEKAITAVERVNQI